MWCFFIHKVSVWRVFHFVEILLKSLLKIKRERINILWGVEKQQAYSLPASGLKFVSTTNPRATVKARQLIDKRGTRVNKLDIWNSDNEFIILYISMI